MKFSRAARAAAIEVPQPPQACNCSRFTWQTTKLDKNFNVAAQREVCIDCKHPTGNTR